MTVRELTRSEIEELEPSTRDILITSGCCSCRHQRMLLVQEEIEVSHFQCRNDVFLKTIETSFLASQVGRAVVAEGVFAEALEYLILHKHVPLVFVRNLEQVLRHTDEALTAR